MKQTFEISKDEALEWLAKEFIRAHPDMDYDKIEVGYSVPLFGDLKFVIKVTNPQQRDTPRSPEFTDRVLKGKKW